MVHLTIQNKIDCDPSSVKCLNGGVLVLRPASGIESVCICDKDFIGENCEVRVDSLSEVERRAFGCQLRPCWIGSTCEDLGDRFVCHCSPVQF
jgi:hypothetical protein